MDSHEFAVSLALRNQVKTKLLGRLSVTAPLLCNSCWDRQDVIKDMLQTVKHDKELISESIHDWIALIQQQVLKGLPGPWKKTPGWVNKPRGTWVQEYHDIMDAMSVIYTRKHYTHTYVEVVQGKYNSKLLRHSHVSIMWSSTKTRYTPLTPEDAQWRQ